jgi:hypothetical protein
LHKVLPLPRLIYLLAEGGAVVGEKPHIPLDNMYMFVMMLVTRGEHAVAEEAAQLLLH